MSGATTPRYRSLERLAKGGMGEVELAVRSEGQFRRLYALKRLHEAMREDESARTMFVDEARLAGLIRHPNVVSVLDVGEDERGPFLAMDFVEGISAATLLRWAARGGVTLPVQICLRIAREIALGLHAAHELRDHDGRLLGLVHRDVSPQNVLIGFDGIARIADFGIAKALGRSTHTTTGLLKGKAGYMSPEQLRFEEPDRRSDIFSLAIVLYELLAGRRLYKAETDLASARRILNEPPPDIDDERADVPPEVVALLFEALAKEPEARPATAQIVAQRLEACIAACVEAEGPLDVGEYVREHFADRRAELTARLADLRTQADLLPPEPARRPSRRARRHAAVAAGVVLALSASIAIGWSLGSADEGVAEAPPTELAGPPLVIEARAESDDTEAHAATTGDVETAPETAPEPPRAETPQRETPRAEPASRRSRARRTREQRRSESDQLFRWD